MLKIAHSCGACILLLAGVAIHESATTIAAQTVAVAPGSKAAGPASTAGAHFDFNGFWDRAGALDLAALFGPPPPTGSKEIIVPLPVRNGDFANLTNDGVLARRSHNNLPKYRPQFWEKVIDLDYEGNILDPVNSCLPEGVTRIGPPRFIIVLPTHVALLYNGAITRPESRLVPFGARTHPVSRDGTWMGDPIARWDGDALLIETEGFNAESWIDAMGYLHGYEMKTTERFQPKGADGYEYTLTVEDPEYLVEPWVKDTIMLTKSKNPNAFIPDTPPCSERDKEHMVGKTREL
jgi:hypothetical protein